MASQGPLLPTSASSIPSGDDAWSNPSNALTENGSSASCSLSGTGVSQVLEVHNFGFSVPTDATIDGVVAEIKRSGGGFTSDTTVKLMVGGSMVGTNKAAAGFWDGSLTFATYGGAADLWGASLTVSNVNNSFFGIGLVANDAMFGTANVDVIRLTVYYTVGGGSYSQMRTLNFPLPILCY